MKTPEEIKEHSPKYKDKAWENYSLHELGNWVHLLHKRSFHRTDELKAKKDLVDARNYWLMMGAWLDDAEEKIRK